VEQAAVWGRAASLASPGVTVVALPYVGVVEAASVLGDDAVAFEHGRIAAEADEGRV
jgi:hypothetical protein